jgi:hypothetical protein
VGPGRIWVTKGQDGFGSQVRSEAHRPAGMRVYARLHACTYGVMDVRSEERGGVGWWFECVAKVIFRT